MPANIFGDRFLGNREPAWHGLGTVFTDHPTVEEAVLRAKLNYDVEKIPIFAIPVHSTSIPIEGKVALVRTPTLDDPNPRVFGIVGEDYSVIQNLDLSRMLNHIGERWPVETVGALGYGETIFITLYAGDDEVNGDQIKKFFLIADSKGSGKALQIAFTPIRVVCQNTLSLGLQQAILSISLRHYENLEGELNFQLGLIERMQNAQTEAMENLRMLSVKRIVAEQVADILLAAYPDPVRPRRARLAEQLPPDALNANVAGGLVQRYQQAQENYERSLEKAESLRDGALRLYNGEHENWGNVAGTAWAAYNSVVEVEDFRSGGNAAANAVFGHRAATKIRAFKKALEV